MPYGPPDAGADIADVDAESFSPQTCWEKLEILRQCGEAAALVSLHESLLFSSKVVGGVGEEMHEFPKLEKTFLDISVKQTVDSVYYCSAFRLQEKVIVRFFETRTFSGATKLKIVPIIADQSRLDDIFTYKVFSESDFQEHFGSKNYKRIGADNHKVLTPADYNRVIKNETESVKKLIATLYDRLALYENFICLFALISFQQLVSQAENCQSDKQGLIFRPFYFDISIKLDPNSLHKFSTAIKTFEKTEEDLGANFFLDNFSMHATLLENQLEVLNSIPNYHWLSHPHSYTSLEGTNVPIKKVAVSYPQYFSTKHPRFLPASPRNRIIYFILRGEMTEVSRTVEFGLAVFSSTRLYEIVTPDSPPQVMQLIWPQIWEVRAIFHGERKENMVEKCNIKPSRKTIEIGKPLNNLKTLKPLVKSIVEPQSVDYPKLPTVDGLKRVEEKETSIRTEDEFCSNEKSESKKIYKCKLCNKIFNRRYNLRVHRVSHTDKSTYQCLVCAKNFVTLHIFKQHISLHGRTIVCKSCDKQFILETDFWLHTRICRVRRCYRCVRCNKTCQGQTNFTNHNCSKKLGP